VGMVWKKIGKRRNFQTKQENGMGIGNIEDEDDVRLLVIIRRNVYGNEEL
jgi:hypothetical protein